MLAHTGGENISPYNRRCSLRFFRMLKYRDFVPVALDGVRGLGVDRFHRFSQPDTDFVWGYPHHWSVSFVEFSVRGLGDKLCNISGAGEGWEKRFHYARYIRINARLYIQKQLIVAGHIVLSMSDKTLTSVFERANS